TEYAVHLVLFHQKIQALGVLGDDLILAVLYDFPIQFARAQTINAIFFGGLEVIVNFGVKQQGLGGNAAHMQACAAELVFFINQAGLQSKLAGAECGGVSAGPAPDNGNVIDGLWQGSAPSTEIRKDQNM